MVFSTWLLHSFYMMKTIQVTSSPVADKVRLRMAKAMASLQPASDYSLYDVALGFRSRGEIDDFSLQRHSDSRTVGRFMRGRSSSRDQCRQYALIALSNGLTLELVQWRNAEIQSETPSRPGHADDTAIYLNGELLGQCLVVEQHKIMGCSCPKRWRLILHGELFGEVEREDIILPNQPLVVNCADGRKLLLKLSHPATFTDFLKALGRLLTLSFLYRPARPNPDLIIPPESKLIFNPEATAFHFAIALVFCTMYFDFNDVD